MDPNVEVALITQSAALLGTALVGLMNWRQNRQLAQQNRQLAHIKHQVQNTHKTNLREDVDTVLAGVETLVEGQRRQGNEIAGLREDMRVERTERMSLSDRVDDHARNHD